MKNIPNLNYRFDDLMHSVVELCIASRKPAKIAFVCLLKDDIYLYKRIASFMSIRKYGVSHYIRGFGNSSVLQFENGSELTIMSNENDWHGKSFTEMVMFCRLDEMEEDTALCLRSCVYSCNPMVFSLLLSRYNMSVTMKDIYDWEAEKA